MNLHILLDIKTLQYHLRLGWRTEQATVMLLLLLEVTEPLYEF